MSYIQEQDRLKPTVLLVAHSGRMLAQAARQAGYHSLVIDLFADQDTEVLAEHVWQVEDLSLKSIRAVIQYILLNYKIKFVIYGSGLDNQLETLTYLAKHFTVVGNDTAVCKQFACKKTFFNQLDVLGIHRPEVQFYPPENDTGWLIKPINHAGGIGISHCNRLATEDEYYQKFCKGQAGSVLFCADGEQFELIGFHRQWAVSQDNFAFAGIIRESFLPTETQQTVKNWLKKLVSYYHLKGLASLDYIWDGKVCYFLEINPRPPASMMLYPELDLLNTHITGRLVGVIDATEIRGLQVIYAKQPCKINSLFEWPEWSFDRPYCNTSLHTNAPICSIIAQEKTVQQTLDSLLARQHFIENNLY